MATLSAMELAYCALILLLAYGLRGSTGFGGAAGMPLLALVVPIKLLVPVWTLLGLASSLAIIGKDRRHIAMKTFAAFIPWCVVGVMVGLYFFTVLDARTLARGLGVLVLGYAAYVYSTTLRPVSDAPVLPRWLSPLAAWLSGVVGAVFGTMATVFFAMYLDSKSMAKSAFRATMSAMLLTLCVAR
ncbi:MAG: TSUP family transporter, partial [Burkholderiales bacterium]